LIIFESVHTSNNNALSVILVVSNLVIEVNVVGLSDFLVLHDGSWHSSDADVDLGEDLQFVPVPKDQHPVWLSSESNDVFVLIFMTESSAQKFSGVVLSVVNIWIWKCLLLLLGVDVIDGAQTSSFNLCCSFTNGKISFRS